MSDDDILKEARDAFALAADAEAENRREALDDLKFARLGEQWPAAIKRERDLDGRPCLTINRLPAFIRQVVNDARQNKPSIVVHPVDDLADLATAEIFNGLIRHIEQSADAEVAYVTHFNFVAAGATNVTLVQGTGVNCGTGQTALTGAYTLTAQSGLAAGGGRGAVLIALPGRAICIINSAAIQVSGAVSYT